MEVTMNDSPPPAWQWIRDQIEAAEKRAKERAERQDRQIADIRTKIERLEEKIVSDRLSLLSMISKAALTGLTLAGVALSVMWTMLKDFFGVGGQP
jgi:hypothetical protein